VAIRDEYKPNLERTIKEGVKIDLDEQLASALLDAEAEPAAAIADLLRFGPPEDQVRALLAVIEGDDASRRTQAVERLGQWAEAWNGDQGVPEAPAGDAASDVAAWKTWYAAMKWYPIPYGESDSQQGEEAEDSAESDASAEPEESAPPEEGAVP